MKRKDFHSLREMYLCVCVCACGQDLGVQMLDKHLTWATEGATAENKKTEM